MIEIDGAYLEGGGQILRTALALSCVTGEPVKIFNIRKNRPNPGLAAQHLNVVKALGSIFNAEVDGAKKGSTKLIFRPGEKVRNHITIDIGTAGSIPLLLQSLTIVSDIKGKAYGGTEVKWSPTIDYVNKVFFKCLNDHGCEHSLTILRRGYYPEGGGYVEFELKGLPKNLFLHERQVFSKVYGVAVNTNLKEDITERLVNSARKLLWDHGFDAKIEKIKGIGHSKGCSLTLWSEKNYIGYDQPCEKGVRAEQIAKEVVHGFLNESGVVDSHLADQLIPFLAMDGKGGFLTSKITNHLRTNIWVCEKFFDVKFEIDGTRIFVI